MMELLVLVIGLIALDLLAVRFGHDSRDGFGAVAHGGETSLMGWSDSTYERELAHEVLQARQHRLARNQVEGTPLQQADDDLALAA
jgi:hypothetical protein